MVAYPIIPPDPTPEELARTRAALGAAAALGDWMAQNLNLDPAKRRKVNEAMRDIRDGMDLVEETEADLSAKTAAAEALMAELFADDP